MRLIDADKIEKVSADPYEQAQFDAEIEDQPTINAITIEWLHSIMEKEFICAMNSNGVIHFVSGAIARQVLANVIELWEKENEESSNRD